MRGRVLPLLVLCAALVAACGPGTPSPGKKIYLEGVGAEGRIGYTEGPDWFRFANAGCAICHGDRGQGLTVRAAGVTGVAPPVTRKALQERGYDRDSLRRALVSGIDPHGREFHYYMPRWRLDERDMAELLDFMEGL